MNENIDIGKIYGETPEAIKKDLIKKIKEMDNDNFYLLARELNVQEVENNILTRTEIEDIIIKGINNEINNPGQLQDAERIINKYPKKSE